MENLGLPLAALIISAGTLLFGALSLRQKASAAYVGTIEERISFLELENKELRKDVENCHRDTKALREENVELMRRLIRADKS